MGVRVVQELVEVSYSPKGVSEVLNASRRSGRGTMVKAGRESVERDCDHRDRAADPLHRRISTGAYGRGWRPKTRAPFSIVKVCVCLQYLGNFGKLQ